MEQAAKNGWFMSPAINTINAMFFIFNVLSISQAGRRRFESGLPLHKINNLQASLKILYLD